MGSKTEVTGRKRDEPLHPPSGYESTLVLFSMGPIRAWTVQKYRGIYAADLIQCSIS